jgi:nitrogen fixation/metabolism regulation signal transduction histidine kinase
MSIKWKFIIWGLLFSLSTGCVLILLLDINNWYFLAGEFFLISSVVMFIILYFQLVKPIGTISSAINLLREKDFSTRLSPVKQKEIDRLVDVFNSMSVQLHLERVEHEEKNLFLDKLINASPSAILVIDGQYNITRLNPAARTLFEIDENLDSPLLFTDLPAPWPEQLTTIGLGDSKSVRIDGIRRFKVSCGSFMDKGFAHPFIMIEEMTRELIRAERQSYEKVIRMMSHEVNNSVGAVNSVMQSVLSLSEQFNENIRDDVSNALRVSMDRNQSLNRFMANFAEVVKLPQPKIQNVNIAKIIDNTSGLFQANMLLHNISLELNIDDFTVKADPVQMEQVLVNIIKNSIEAIDKEGVISICTNNNPLSVSITDSGNGFSDETNQKLFTPFYSTKKTGQGIGLTLIREILLNHSFNFKLHRINDKTQFLIEFE